MTRPDGFSGVFKAYLIDPCKCVNCSKADPKNEDQQSDFEAITQFFFRESQKDVMRQALIWCLQNSLMTILVN